MASPAWKKMGQKLRKPVKKYQTGKSGMKTAKKNRGY